MERLIHPTKEGICDAVRLHMFNHRSLLIWVAAAMIAAPLAPVHAQTTLSSTNTEAIQKFWFAMNDTTRPVTVMSFGDSMSLSYSISSQYYLFKQLRDQFGLGGITLQTVFNYALYNLGNGTQLLNSTANWWTKHFSVPPDGYLYWTKQTDPTGSVLSDEIGLFWIAHPEGGSFSLSVSTNGGAWGSILSLEGYSPQPKGCYTNMSMIRDGHRLRVDGGSGTNLILGPRYLDSNAEGVDLAFMALGGANLDEIFSLSTNVLYPIVKAIDPKLVVFHMKEVGDIGTTSLSNRLYDLEALWDACVPNGDIVYIGTPFEASDLTTNRTETQNILIREAAVRDGRAYVDCMTPMISYESMSNHGHMADNIHLNATGNQVLADILWNQLGLYALRLDWASRTNISWDLQSTSNVMPPENLRIVVGDESQQD